MSEKIPIFVAGFPKSGTTWLTRLLGDVLSASTGGSVPRLDKTEIATEGLNRPSIYTVRKGHFVLKNTTRKRWPTEPHVLTLGDLQHYDVIHIIRDPRDIAVSAMHHWNSPLKQIVNNMIGGKAGFRHVGPWRKYVSSWKDLPFVFTVTYENLHRNSLSTVNDILNFIDIPIPQEAVLAAISRQQFSARVVDVEKNGKSYPLGYEFNRKFLRKGEVGDWENYFDQYIARYFEAHFGEIMRELGYVDSENWWKTCKL